ncbi:MAG: AMP-binding protein, partial [Ketobacter sp.]|nr:AMP-binding protein [Ketobacter sp.]
SAVPVVLLAVWKAGGVAVPVDPQQPVERSRQALADAGVGVLVSQGELAAALHGGDMAAVRLEDASLAGESTSAVAAAVAPCHLAYVIYTSGSTGIPKGVAVEHRQVVPVLLWGVEYLRLGRSTRVLQNLSYCFDFGLFEVVTTLLAGGTLVYAPSRDRGDFARTAELIAAEGVNTLHTTPTFVQELLAQAGSLPSLRTVHLGGEALLPSLVESIEAATPVRCRVYNGYGPTE